MFSFFASNDATASSALFVFENIANYFHVNWGRFFSSLWRHLAKDEEPIVSLASLDRCCPGLHAIMHAT